MSEADLPECFECHQKITGWVEQELRLCTRCQNEAQDRKDHQAALLGADLALGQDVSSHAFKALDGALKLLNGGGK